MPHPLLANLPAPQRARALSLRLQQGDYASALAEVRQLGDPALRRQLLREAGYGLLWRPERAACGALLQAELLQGDGPDLHGLRLLELIEAQRLPHEAERLLRAQALEDPGLRALVESRCAQMYDAPADALRLAEQAAAQLGRDPLHPLALHAAFALGFARLDAGLPDAALAPLQQALRGADRDGLALLRIDALHLLARVHEEGGRDAERDACIASALALRALLGADLAPLPALDSIERLAALAALRRGVAVPLQGNGFAHRALAARQALVAGRAAEACKLVQALRHECGLRYLPRKWQHELRALEAALAAQGLAPWPGPGTLADAGLYALQEQVLDQGIALLRGQALRAQGLMAELQGRGLLRLAQRLALQQALHTQDGAALARWLAEPAADVLDLFGLAPLALPALERALREPTLAAAQLPPLLALRERLLGPTPPAAAGPPPAELTAREWQVLQLIGQGLSNAQIASRLRRSHATVKTHINRLYAKLELSCRSQAVQRSRQLQNQHSHPAETQP